MTVSPTVPFELRCRELGHEIFERARTAEPRPWQTAWWQQQVTQLCVRDERFKTQMFRFVDVLPALGDDADVARHLQEYFDPRRIDVPAPLRLALSFRSPDSVWGRSVGALARRSAVPFARRFITGFTAAEAIGRARQLRDRRMTFTMDVLGEATVSEKQADRYAEAYQTLIATLADAAPSWPAVPQIDEGADGPLCRVNVSLKLSALYSQFDAIDPRGTRRQVCARLRPILRLARERGAFVNVDLESYRERALTLDIFRTLLMEPQFRDWSDVGIVVQAYLRAGESDLQSMLDWVKRRGTRISIRLVKGAYWEHETFQAVRGNAASPVWTRKWESDANFEKLGRVMLEHHRVIRPKFASHNVRSLAAVLAAAEELGLSRRDYEVQMLYGMGNPLKTAMVDLGHTVRVYCPYGKQVPGMAYLIRRLLENTSNDSFLKQSFGDRAAHDRLLADPAVVRPPSAPLPRRIRVDPDQERPMTTFTNTPAIGFGDPADRARMTEAIQRVRSGAGHTYSLVINDRNVATEEWYESVNPSRPRETVGRVALATPQHADRAVTVARQALSDWRRRSAAERGHLLGKLSALMTEHRFDLAACQVLECGKPWREAAADVAEAVDYTNFYAAEMEVYERRPRQRHLPGEANVMVYEPRGVCAVISPWDFPLALLAGMTTAALAAGNTVILKPARAASVTAARFAELFREVGFPPGVVNFLPGVGEIIGRHFAEQAHVPTIAFTGSRDVGLDLIERAARCRPGQPFVKKVVAHMGGKNAVIVDHDSDLDEAVRAVVGSAFAYAGQKCTACSRVIVLADVYDQFATKLCDATESLIVGDAAEPGTVVGPVISDAARERIRRYVDAGRQYGQVLREVDVSHLTDGYFVGPTIIGDVDPQSPIAQQEILGPVLALIRAEDFAHAIEIANGTCYALTGGVFTRSPAHVEQARRDLEVGNLYINRPVTGSAADVQPFGGFKLSGNAAKIGGPDYLLEFTRSKTITESTIRHGFAPVAGGETTI